MDIYEFTKDTSNLVAKLDVFDYGTSLPKDFQDKNDLLHDLFESILSVSDKYILYKDKASDKEKKHLERVFAYELYRQWANRIQFKWGEKLVINGEIEKEPKIFDHFKSRVHKFPDLVLHKGQGNSDFQGIVCEIKTTHVTPSSFKKDIDKLNCFTCCEEDNYRFSFGVFILVGDEMSKILTMMDDIGDDVFNSTSNKYFNKLICVSYNHGHLKAVRFDWLIKKRDRDKLRK